MKYLRSAKDDRAIAMFHLLLDTGIRLSELAGIKMIYLDMNNRSLIVYGKGGKQRQVYLNKECASAIYSYLPDLNRGTKIFYFSPVTDIR